MEKEYSAKSAGAQVLRANTPIDKMSNAGSFVHDLCSRIENLADKLVGPTPETGQDDKCPSPSCGGIFGSIEMEAAELERRLGSAASAITRIEQALP